MPSFKLSEDNEAFLEDQKWRLRTTKTTVINTIVDYFRERPEEFKKLMEEAK